LSHIERATLADMEDRLTQLQNAVDMLAVQFYSAINHINNEHGSVSVNGETRNIVPSEEHSSVQKENEKNAVMEGNVKHWAKLNQGSMKELSADMITKMQQIDLLITSLPGLDKSEGVQMSQIQELERALSHSFEKKRELEARTSVLNQQISSIIRSRSGAAHANS